MYCMYHGGTRIMMNATGGTGPTYAYLNPNLSFSKNDGGNSAVIGQATQILFGARPANNAPFLFANAVAVQDSNDGIAFTQAPYYVQTKASLSINDTLGTYNINHERSNSCSIQGFYQSGMTGFRLWRSFPDEFQLCFFIGAPPVLISWV